MPDVPAPFMDHLTLVQSFDGRDLGEADTRAHLIDPMLRILGYVSIDDVRYEVPLPASRDFLDYVLYRDGSPFCIVEAKPLRTSITIQAAAQCVQYASVAGVRWCLVTNGREWSLYDAHGRGPLADKHVASVSLASQSSHAAWDLLCLFAKNATTPAADPLVRLIVRRAVEDELSRPDSKTVATLRKAVRERFGETVSAAMVLDVLRNGDVLKSDNEPLTQGPAAPSSARLTGGAPRFTRQRGSGIAEMVRSGLLLEGGRLEGPVSNDVGIVRAEGIEVNGVVHSSPSAAASAARNGGSVNGWLFWRYQGTPLAVLRERLERKTQLPTAEEQGRGGFREAE